MKILHVITTLESGGAERMLSNLVNLDDENEHIIITVLEGEVHYNIKENVQVINLELNNTMFSRFKMIYKIMSIIKKFKPDIVQTWLKLNYLAPLFKLLIKKPKYVINIRHGVRKKYNSLSSFFERKYLGYVDGIIFVSQTSKKEFAEQSIFFSNSVVITNGFNKKNRIYKTRNKNEIFKIGYVGRKHPVKNQQLLFEAFNEFSKNKKVELHIAGKNMTFKEFSSVINPKAAKHIIWYGELSNPFEIYESIDVLVLTSDTEGFPNVIGEAMSIGVPVISTNAGESWDIIRESGFKINSDKKSLIHALEQAYYNPDILNSKSVEAFNNINNNYTLEKIIQQYKNYYREVLK